MADPPPDHRDSPGSGGAAMDGMTPGVDVVAAVVRDHRGRLLIGRRPEGKRHAGLWEFPGGKLQPGESLAAAARRELDEELALRLEWTAPEPLFLAEDPGQPFRIHFLQVRASGTPKLREHQAVAWTPVPVPRDYPLAPGDLRFARALAEGRIRLEEDTRG